MAKLRDKPYVHVSWLSKILSGTNHCEWAYWFKSHYTAKKRSGSNQYVGSDSQIAHTAMIKKQKQELEDEGYSVSVEDQNRFSWEGNTAVLGGTPDLVAVSPEDSLVVDVKSGTESPAHEVQLLIYMWALPLERRFQRQHADRTFRGLLVYKDSFRFIENSKLTSKFIKSVTDLIKRLSGDQPPKKAPSSRECGFCDISDEDCKDRFIEELIEAPDPSKNEFF